MSAVPMHGIATRHDLPLPFSFVLAGAAVTLVVTFVLLGYAWRRPRFSQPSGVALPGLTRMLGRRSVRGALQGAVLAVYGWAGLALVAGRDLLTNPVFGFVFVWMWVGLVPLSLLFGTWWRATNPLRTVHRGLCAMARADPDIGLVTLPARIGTWPAAAALFAFAWLELVQPDRATLAVLRVWAAGWVVLVVLGALVFGSRWISAADPFEVYATVVAQLSPLRRVDDELRLVNPLAGLAAWHPPPGSVAVVAVLLGGTAYDSFANTSWWIQTVQSSTAPSLVWATVGLLTLVTVVGVSFALAASAMALPGAARAKGVGLYPRLMAASVVPIVVGYAVAHYATLLVVEGQRTAINFSDPLGRGWNVFGSAGRGVDAGIYDHPTAIALLQLGAIVLGHVVGIVAAHERALSLSPARVVRGQWPLLAVMVAYTTAGLLLLFSP